MLIHIIKSNWQVVIACVFDENILVHIVIKVGN